LALFQVEGKKFSLETPRMNIFIFEAFASPLASSAKLW